MFETGFFSLFDGLGFLGGVICAIILIGVCFLQLFVITTASAQQPILFIIISVLYWFIIIIEFTSVCIWHIVIYGIYFIMWLLCICAFKNDNEFKKDKFPVYLTIMSAISFIGSIFLVSDL